MKFSAEALRMHRQSSMHQPPRKYHEYSDYHCIDGYWLEGGFLLVKPLHKTLKRPMSERLRAFLRLNDIQSFELALDVHHDEHSFARTILGGVFIHAAMDIKHHLTQSPAIRAVHTIKQTLETLQIAHQNQLKQNTSSQPRLERYNKLLAWVHTLLDNQMPIRNVVYQMNMDCLASHQTPLDPLNLALIDVAHQLMERNPASVPPHSYTTTPYPTNDRALLCHRLQLATRALISSGNGDLDVIVEGIDAGSTLFTTITVDGHTHFLLNASVLAVVKQERQHVRFNNTPQYHVYNHDDSLFGVHTQALRQLKADYEKPNATEKQIKKLAFLNTWETILKTYPEKTHKECFELTRDLLISDTEIQNLFQNKRSHCLFTQTKTPFQHLLDKILSEPITHLDCSEHRSEKPKIP